MTNGGKPFGAEKPDGPVPGDARATHQKHPGGMFLRAPKRKRWASFLLAQGSFLGFAFWLRQAFSPIQRGLLRKAHSWVLLVGKPALFRLSGGDPLSVPTERGERTVQGLAALENPAPAHRRRALGFGPRNRRFHWRKTPAPSKGGLHESQPAYPGRSIAAGVRCG